jgi:hypothetical protein
LVWRCSRLAGPLLLFCFGYFAVNAK